MSVGQAGLVSGSIQGIESIPVSVQVQIAQGLPSFKIVGLADASVLEAKERVISSLKASGLNLPASRITINLAPASLKKCGSSFDLSIAVALLVAMGKLPAKQVKDCLFVGELSLDGSINEVRGINVFAEQARKSQQILVGHSVKKAAALTGVRALELTHLREVFDFEARRQTAGIPFIQEGRVSCAKLPDFSDIAGQENAKRALTIAAAGGHNILLIGPPGTGKTMLASALRSVMPDLGHKETVETALIHSVSGKEQGYQSTQIPFRSPHHSSSLVGLIGGGNPVQPGEVSLAHNGVLFLDEIAQFSPSALQALRTPLQDGEIRIVRGDYTLTFPSHFQLVAASNPCPCGYFGDDEKSCNCTSAEVNRYQSRIGGPLLDRFDLVVWVRRIKVETLLSRHEPAISSAEIRERVLRAHERRTKVGRLRVGLLTKDELIAELASSTVKQTLERAASRLNLSGRAIIKILRVARTIADLEAKDKIDTDSILEALGFRAGWEQ